MGCGGRHQLSPALGFDDVVHQRTRLGILAVLAEATEADFTYLRKVLDLTDGNLGRHLEILESAGLITISKGYHGRRPRTWAWPSHLTTGADRPIPGRCGL